jgi:sialate O-acetylesterase
VLQFPVKGVIWYQGESNDRCPGEYAALFPALIHDLREKTARPDLPFIFTQLPIWGSPSENNEANSWAIIREAQHAALSLAHTGMAAALDLGEWNDLHPLNKKDVGLRLALAAEKLVFGADNTSPGPLLRETEMCGDRLVMRFDNCGGLHSEGQSFVSVVSDNGRLRLPLAIEGPDCISVDLSAVENPQRVLYAWADNPRDRQLFNSEGLPVLPFRLAL